MRGCSRHDVDAFRLRVIAAKEVGAPIVKVEDCSFLYTRHGDMYVVGVTKRNCNPAAVFEYI